MIQHYQQVGLTALATALLVFAVLLTRETLRVRRERRQRAKWLDELRKETEALVSRRKRVAMGFEPVSIQPGGVVRLTVQAFELVKPDWLFMRCTSPGANLTLVSLCVGKFEYLNGPLACSYFDPIKKVDLPTLLLHQQIVLGVRNDGDKVGLLYAHVEGMAVDAPVLHDVENPGPLVAFDITNATDNPVSFKGTLRGRSTIR